MTLGLSVMGLALGDPRYTHIKAVHVGLGMDSWCVNLFWDVR